MDMDVLELCDVAKLFSASQVFRSIIAGLFQILTSVWDWKLCLFPQITIDANDLEARNSDHIFFIERNPGKRKVIIKVLSCHFPFKEHYS